MVKLQRNYILTISFDNGELPLVIKPPFTLEFDVGRDTLGGLNYGQFRIYNLSERNRSLLRKDITAFTQFIGLNLKAGYGNDLSTVFNGTVSQGWSVREGVNFISTLKCLDGGFAAQNAFNSLSFESGTENKKLILDFVDKLKSFNVKPGAIGNYPGKINRGNSYTGSVLENLSDLTNRGFFIDNGKANCLQNDEYIEDGTPLLLNAQSGLLGTPFRENNNIKVEMLFEPKVQVAHAVRLESATSKNFNGIYKVVGLRHSGIISEAVSGNSTTTAFLFAPKKGVSVRSLS